MVSTAVAASGTPSCYCDAITMANAPQDLHRTTIYLTPRQYAWLRSKAFNEALTIAAVVRQILEAARRTEEPQEELPLSGDES